MNTLRPTSILPFGYPRIDVMRRTDTDSEGNEFPVDYSQTGIDLGDGIFYDLAGHITISPDRAMGEQAGKNDFGGAHLDSPGWNDTRVSRSGENVLVDGPGWNDFRINEKPQWREMIAKHIVACSKNICKQMRRIGLLDEARPRRVIIFARLELARAAL